jgi:hypothetical protein
VEEFIYVSAVKGHLVTRFPTVRGALQYIGATRTGKVIEWNEKAVVAIPTAEWNRYRREYERAVRQGAIVLKTKVDHAEWLKARAAADEEIAAKAKAAGEAARAKAEAEAKS